MNDPSPTPLGPHAQEPQSGGGGESGRSDAGRAAATLSVPVYLTTAEAASYLRRSVSWLLRQKRIPYYPGKPNRYRREDLDCWMDESVRHEPLL